MDENPDQAPEPNAPPPRSGPKAKRRWRTPWLLVGALSGIAASVLSLSIVFGLSDFRWNSSALLFTATVAAMLGTLIGLVIDAFIKLTKWLNPKSPSPPSPEASPDHGRQPSAPE